MAIMVAYQRDNLVFVYDETNTCLCMREGELIGFTSSTFTVRKNGLIYVFDEKGSLKFLTGGN